MKSDADSKKVLFLGGAASQVVAIKRSKEFGFRTICCDCDSDCPGASASDVFYNVSTLDERAIESIVLNEAVSGIVAYATDRAAPVASRIAERFGLPGSPSYAIEAFCDKGMFRRFLADRGFMVPKGVIVAGQRSTDLEGLSFPLMVKPVDSAGSRGVSVVESPEGLQCAISTARDNSMKGAALLEERIESAVGFGVEAEIFAVAGEVVTWGLMRSVRDGRANPLVPAGYVMPLNLPNGTTSLIKQEISRLVRESGILTGAFNIELILGPKGDVYFIDVGPRNGGNMLPEFISEISGADTIGATVLASVGCPINVRTLRFDGVPEGYWFMHVIHVGDDGVFERTDYSPFARRHLVRESVWACRGDCIHRLSTSADALGVAMFHFGSEEDLSRMLDDTDGHICVAVR